MSEVYCLGATVIAKNKKVAEKFEREYYESRGEKYIPHAFTKVDKKGDFKL